ncbi:Phosphatidylinositol N-acetylglucosaminyltransferase [Metarhizium album ARSEF 1941]|uniref:Phosphatidylinositol N-acetylglucosaminyltransferase n=1 Tax=Metarhizium album (strain ARSEF 1941) TaxID=1081103 RepID=A0A0B2WRE0_METAS|nr:Phosphatidylinositol N-acetylglucosaminyltransferase [Metarhizium album ARSEF 1941]KHN96067.1 Phosphatidylinositol N-acetylglucosaminyltransferase [Metarhizium album ARSEF 1941]
MPSPTDDETPFPSLGHAATFGNFGRSHLSPQDAHLSPPRRARDFDGDGAPDMRRLGGGGGSDRSRSRRRKRAWKKLMWVKQSCNVSREPPTQPAPQAVRLLAARRRLHRHPAARLLRDHIHRLFRGHIPRARVARVGGQLEQPGHLCGLDPVGALGVRGGGRGGRGQRGGGGVGGGPGERGPGARRARRPPHPLRVEAMSSPVPTPSSGAPSPAGSTASLHGRLAPSTTAAATSTTTTATSPSRLTPKTSSEALRGGSVPAAGEPLVPLDENRTHQRLGTIKSALLIWSTLLGLSPILRSLTESTSSDSIWAISFWLLAINIFFFDYSGGVGAKFPASLSTNAALMASTVLASRLPSTGQVFSLTLFSIEVFGLFPVFRRHVRHRSWRYHVVQTVVLVLGAGLGVGMVVGAVQGSRWPWKSGIVGMVFSVVIAALATGGCSWWLIGLQKYKNEIRGPWDPARPIIMSRTRWDDG